MNGVKEDKNNVGRKRAEKLAQRQSSRREESQTRRANVSLERIRPKICIATMKLSVPQIKRCHF